MSVLTQIGVEIDRIETAKASIKAAIEGKGVSVPSDTKIDGMAALISSISGGTGDVLKTCEFFPPGIFDNERAYYTSVVNGVPEMVLKNSYDYDEGEPLLVMCDSIIVFDGDNTTTDAFSATNGFELIGETEGVSKLVVKTPSVAGVSGEILVKSPWG